MTEYDVVLLPSFAQVEDWRKRGATEQSNGLFSQVVSTFNAWITDLWELHGDGRAIADSLQRQTIMHAAFERMSGNTETDTDSSDDELTMLPGVVKLAARCVREAAGVPAFERAVDQAHEGVVPEGLTVREAILLDGIGLYRELLETANLIEVGHAAAYLATVSDRVFPAPQRVLVAQTGPLDWQKAAFFDECSQLTVDAHEAPGADGIDRMPERVPLRFGFPSGRYAQPALIVDLVRNYIESGNAAGESGTTVVACKDPLALYKHVEAALADMGAIGSVQAQVPFHATDFGRQFISMARAVMDESWSKDDLSDAVVPPFSGFEKADALEIDKELRANRLAERDECLERLRAKSDLFSQFEELASDPEADILLGVFEQIAFNAAGRSAAWRAEQLAAAAALRSCTTAARKVGASMRACVNVLQDVKVTASYETAGSAEAGAHRVAITTQSAACQMGAGSCRQLILADLTSEDYPVAERDDSASTLFARIGLLPVETALARARRTFAALQGLPTGEMVCLRPLNDWNGNPTYPAAVLQELIDAYRDDVSSQDDLDEVFALTDSLRASMVQRGEELLYANAVAGRPEGEQDMGTEVVSAVEDDVSAAKYLVAVPRRTAEGTVIPGFSPSPSQVEAYLECPRKWFVQNRLNVEGLDEGFGALERGSFAHAVLQRFYGEFQAAGHCKVDASNLALAKETMRVVADCVERDQRLAEPGSGRYVAADPIEQRELEACKDQLVAFLDFESKFLPTFQPRYLEFAITPEDGVLYAGHPFVGMVDRIDVDDAGHAVIVDYKGSVNTGHEIAGKGQDDPGKVQTRMYAQAVRRLLGLNVVGALYVSYGKSPACAGAFDGCVLEAAHLPAMRIDRCSCIPSISAETPEAGDYSSLAFADMLDETERLVERAIDAMQEGIVHPDPINSDACRYCPVAVCSKRGA